MRLDDINPRYKTTEAAPAVDPDMVKVPGMVLVHVGALQQNIAKKIAHLSELVASGDAIATVEAHRLMHGAAFNAMFDALATALEARK
jgi:hypothetical protein